MTLQVTDQSVIYWRLPITLHKAWVQIRGSSRLRAPPGHGQCSGRAPLRELSRRVVAVPARTAPGGDGDLPVRAHRGRPGRRRRAHAPSARGPRRPSAPTCRRCRTGVPDAALADGVPARWPVLRQQACRRTLLPCSTPSSRTCSRRATPTARSCSTTAAARPTRSGACCCTCMACGDGALRQSDAICTALQLANFWQDLSVDRPRGRLYVPRPTCAATGSTCAGCWSGRRCRDCSALVADLVRWARELMADGAPLACACPAAPAGNCAWWCKAACASSRRSTPWTSPLSQRPRVGRTTRTAAAVARTVDAPAALARQAKPPSAPSSTCRTRPPRAVRRFYYAFLFLPPPRRAAITAFYAFCREVDDVVDEVSDPGVAATKLMWWRKEVASAFAGQPSHPVMKALMPLAADSTSKPAHLMAVIDGCQMDLEQSRYLDFAGPVALLPPGGRHRRRGRGQHLRPHRSGDRAVCAPARPGDAAHQHHPRRRRRRAARPHLPADVGAEAVRREGAGDPQARGATAIASPR